MTSQAATAGGIFLSRAAFLAAATPTLAEDFSGFPIGPVPNPLTIMGGAAEVFDGFPSIGTFFNGVGGPSPSQAWIANISNPTPAGIRGVGATSLGFTALAFDYAHQFPGSWAFAHSGGTDFGPLVGAGPAVMTDFVGWVGNAGEVLNMAAYGAGGIILDNIVATTSNVIPEPGTILLLGVGLAGSGAARFGGEKRQL
jgi:hypothetical protein